jgi:FMN phosphatase YigB (HAD superfamily)
MENVTGPVYVVGDYLHNEIRMGNKLGAKTIWFKQGRFSTLEPETEQDIPWKTITDMKQLHELI